MKKKILFVMSRLYMGGIEKEILILLNSIDKDRYACDLYLTGSGGPLEKEIPKHISIKRPEYKLVFFFFKLIVRGHLLLLLKKIYYYLRVCSSKGEKRDYWGAKISVPLLGEYDCVIAFNGMDLAVIGTAEAVSTKKRFVWMHSSLVGLDNTKRLHVGDIIRRFNKVICVSKTIKNEYLKEYHLKDDNIVVIYNILDIPTMVNGSQIPIFDMHSGSAQSLLTVGRLHTEKGQMIIPKITRMLIDAGYNIRWYLVGDGNLRQDIKESCQTYDVSDRVVLLGMKSNPYPYIKNCDVYVQTSISEGWCLTVQEARFFCKPIVVTPLPVMYEQIDDGKTGIIAKDNTADELFISICRLLDDKELRDRMVFELKKEKHCNTYGINKLYEMIEFI